MKRLSIIAALAACTVSLSIATVADALEKSDPGGCAGGGYGMGDGCAENGGGNPGGPGPGDPILDPSKMPPGGDAAGEAAAERAEKAAEKKRKEAEKRKEEERKKREAEAALRAAMAPKPTMVAKEAQRVVVPPEILEPRPASTHPPQTPLKIRVAAPRNLAVQSYELQFESKQPNGSWQVQTNVRVSAAEVEGPLGYKGWGWHQPGTGTQMTATAGVYRLRARTVNPDQGEAGAWREFTIAGDPGPGPDVMKSNVLSGLGRGGASPEPARAPSLSAVAKPRSAMAGQGVAAAPSKAPLQKAASSFDASGRPATLDWSKAAPSAYAPQLLQRSQP